MPRNVTYLVGSTRKLYQLTGECDRERSLFAINRTESRFGLIGTDLGSSFEHNERIYFLFGDTNATRPDSRYRPLAGDSIAYTDDTDPDRGIDLHFITAPDGDYLSPQVSPY